jgi:hypothetical protein
VLCGATTQKILSFGSFEAIRLKKVFRKNQKNSARSKKVLQIQKKIFAKSKKFYSEAKKFSPMQRF